MASWFQVREIRSGVARASSKPAIDGVMLVDTAVRNLFTQKNLQSHQAHK
jgi:hypothetical protein